MKKLLLILLCVPLLFSSCYIHTYTVGDGPQKGISVTSKQHNFVAGLVSGKSPNIQEMAKGSENYEIVTMITVADFIVTGLVGIVYAPTTVIVTR